MKTMKEIFDQPETLRIAVEEFGKIAVDALRLISRKLPRRFYFVGCGTSYYIAMGLSEQIRRLSNRKISTGYFSGSEIMLGLNNIEDNSVVVAISRSGESSETVAALEICSKRENVSCISLTCGPKSKIISHSDASIVLDFASEDSVVMTKSFSAMSFVASTLIRALFRPDCVGAYQSDIVRCSEETLQQSKEVIDELNLKRLDSFVFLGYNEYLAACFEGTIKVIETSLASSNAFQTLEYRHGPISALNSTTLVCILPSELSSRHERALVRDIRDKGGNAICISSVSSDHGCYVTTGYRNNDYGDWFLRVIPMQLIGVKRAEGLGINPDRPANLSKVVKLRL